MKERVPEAGLGASSNDLGELAATCLRRWARDEVLTERFRRDPALRAALRRAAFRYLAGSTREECIALARELTANGGSVTLDYAGEAETDPGESECHTAEYARLISDVSAEDFESQVSIDLSQIGLMIDPQAALERAVAIAAEGADAGVTLMLNMGPSGTVDETLAAYRALSEKVDNVGITIQAYLPRSADDVEELLALPGKIRLVKGAYGEAPGSIIPRGPELDRAYVSLAERLLSVGHPVSIATHDPAIVDHLLQTFSGSLSSTSLEFEFLYGAADAVEPAVRDAGLSPRIFLTYGSDCFLFACHRMAEHPPALLEAIDRLLQPESSEEAGPLEIARSRLEMEEQPASVLLVNQALDGRGLLANAAFVVGLTSGREFSASCFGHDVVDGDGSVHRYLTNVGHIVRKGSPSKLRTIRSRAQRDPRITVVDYPESAATSDYVAYERDLRKHAGDTIEYRAIHLFGPREVVWPLTKNLSLLS